MKPLIKGFLDQVLQFLGYCIVIVSPGGGFAD